MPQGAGRPFQRRRLIADGAFRTEVRYCTEKGIPHKEFLARWDNEDRAKLIADLTLQAEKCSMCGTAEWEWLADPSAYEAMWHDCRGCMRKDGFRDGEGQQTVAGRSVVLKSREEYERLTLNPAAAPQVPRLSKRTRERRPKP